MQQQTCWPFRLLSRIHSPESKARYARGASSVATTPRTALLECPMTSLLLLLQPPYEVRRPSCRGPAQKGRPLRQARGLPLQPLPAQPPLPKAPPATPANTFPTPTADERSFTLRGFPFGPPHKMAAPLHLALPRFSSSSVTPEHRPCARAIGSTLVQTLSPRPPILCQDWWKPNANQRALPHGFSVSREAQGAVIPGYNSNGIPGS